MADDSATPSPLERQLIEAVTRGEQLDLAGDGSVDADAMDSWDAHQTLQAWVLRDILRGVLAPQPDPRGLRLRGARIVGCLDLENLTTSVDLRLTDCFLPDGLVLCDAHLFSLWLSRCRINQPAGSTNPPIHGERLTIRVLSLAGTTVSGHSDGGAVRLSGAHIDGDFFCTGMRLENDIGPALFADDLRVDQDAFLDEGFTAVGEGADGAVRLPGAHIGCQLDFGGAQLKNKSGPALFADGLRVDQSAFLNGGFTAVGDGDGGAVRLLGAHIGGQLDCSSTRLENRSGPALVADGLQVDQKVDLSGRFTALGGGGMGAVQLVGAHIGGQLACCRAQLENSTGPGLNAAGLCVDQDAFLNDGFTAIGDGDDGAVILSGAYLGGGLDCGGARLENRSGPALVADGLQVDQNMHLNGGFTALGAKDQGTVRLLGAHIGGQLDCSSARLENNSGPALIANRLQVDDDLFLCDGFTAVGVDGAVLVLVDVRVGGRLYLDVSKVTRATDGGNGSIILDGITYAGLPQLEPGWRTVLRDRTSAYAAQPYQYLATAYRAAGDDHTCRRILIAQRNDRIDCREIRGWERAWDRLTGLTLGYGYQPWRALLGLLLVVVVSVGVSWTAGRHGGLAHTDRIRDLTAACTTSELIGVGLDLGTPLLKTTARDTCAATATAVGQCLTIAGWFLQILAWAFAALFIAGFTSAVRKT